MAPIPGKRSFPEVLERRLSRRDVIVSGGLLAAAELSGCTAGAGAPSRQLPARIESSIADTVVVPDGYRADVVLRWGDPILAGSTGLDIGGIPGGSLFADGAGADQAGSFGTNCDGIGLLELAPDRLVICVNHEFVSPETMFPGWVAARAGSGIGAFVAARPESVAVMQASVGVSIVELARRDGVWRAVPGAPINRRITATTPVSFSGPAAAHPWLGGRAASATGACLGTFGNCAAGMTPWGTYLTAEENVDDFFGNAAAAVFDENMAGAHRRFGLRFRDSAFRWEFADSRFDLAQAPAELFKFGWIVEIDPLNREAPVRKRTALGRFKHEGATTMLAGDGRPVVYMGDDEVFEYLYKFVGDGRFDPADPAASRDLLDRGTLYVARLHEDGSGEWLPLVWNGHPSLTAQAGFADQGDILIRCREAADLLGATALDRPEDVAVSPVTGNIYLSCTMNGNRGSGNDRLRGRVVDTSPDPANPRPFNQAGHILELIEDDGDFTSVGFRWNVFVLAGDPQTDGLQVTQPVPGGIGSRTTYYSGQGDAGRLSAFANPDNLGFDASGNLWIVTDGSQPQGNNNGCFVCPTSGPDRGAVQQFMSGPVGAEICGCDFAPDGQTLFLTVQHPGRGGIVERPVSDWPDGRGRPPRSSLVAISRSDETLPFAG